MFTSFWTYVVLLVIVCFAIYYFVSKSNKAKLITDAENLATNTFKPFMEFKWVLTLLGISLGLYLIGEYIFNEVIAFAAGTFCSAIVIFIFSFTESKLLGKVDSITEIITNRNVAYALFLIAVALLISISFFGAFAVFIGLNFK
jgi:uncharacterized membrane protein YjfL (UPF0719 family)